eukprot:144091-Pyramimonas_sp.AAC.1
MRRLRPRRNPRRLLFRLRRRLHLMSTPGGPALIHALGKKLTRKHGFPANGGNQAQQSTPLGGGVNCSPTMTLGVKRVSALPLVKATHLTRMPKAGPYGVATSSRRIFVVLR